MYLSKVFHDSVVKNIYSRLYEAYLKYHHTYNSSTKADRQFLSNSLPCHSIFHDPILKDTTRYHSYQIHLDG